MCQPPGLSLVPVAQKPGSGRGRIRRWNDSWHDQSCRCVVTRHQALPDGLSSPASWVRSVARSLALGNPDQAVAGDDRAVGGHEHVAKGNQPGQMRRRYLRIG
jgi:hypothetical protein